MLIKKTQKKLNQYGLMIYNKYFLEEGNNEYIFILENAVVLVKENENTLGIAFQVTTKPETAATLTLILKEIKCKEVFVMESFIFDYNNLMISGDDAYKLVKKTKENNIREKVLQEQVYINVLQNSKCYHC